MVNLNNPTVSHHSLLLPSPDTQTFQLPASTDPRDSGSDDNNMEVRRGPDLGWLFDLQVGVEEECQAGPSTPQLPN